MPCSEERAALHGASIHGKSLGYVVVDRPADSDEWWVEHSGSPWLTRKEADAERASCLADAPEGHRYEVALVILPDGAA